MAQEGLPRFLGAGDFTYRGGPVPRFVAGKGSRLFDSEGRTYVDAEAANGSVSLGYDSEILEVASRATALLPALPSFCESDARIKVAQRLEAEVSCAVGTPGRISFEVGGAQGIELAMKIVAANRGWGPVVTLQGGYHGRSPFTGALSASARYRQPIPVGAGEIVRLPFPDCERCPFGLAPADCETACMSYLRFLQADQSGVPDEVCALLFEPLLNVAGMALPPTAYLREAIAKFQASGALVVVDEIFTGFHRVGPRFGFELHGVTPDIVVLSKALTNGAAGLSAVWAREPLLDPEHFRPGTHSATFSGTPFMLAVVDAVLDRFADREAWAARVVKLESSLRDLVSEAAEAVPGLVRAAEAHGAVARLLLRAPSARDVRTAALHGVAGSDAPGVLLASTGMSPDVIALHPPLTIEAEDLAVVRDGLLRALHSVARA
ncbi:MAG: aminotransferase class III-fold pyridoxal phosphate-dependent enzyme [Solirubrobacterales bacterium]